MFGEHGEEVGQGERGVMGQRFLSVVILWLALLGAAWVPTWVGLPWWPGPPVLVVAIVVVLFRATSPPPPPGKPMSRWSGDGWH